MGLGQNLEPGAVPRGQVGDAASVAAAVLRPVGQHRAVRPDRGGDPSPWTVAGLSARVAGQLDAAAQQAFGVRSVEAAGGEPLERGLVARGRGDRGARSEECPVHGQDLVGPVEEQPRRPQRIGQVVAARFQRAGHAAIADQHRAARAGKGHDRDDTTPAAEAWPSWWSPGAGGRYRHLPADRGSAWMSADCTRVCVINAPIRCLVARGTTPVSPPVDKGATSRLPDRRGYQRPLGRNHASQQQDRLGGVDQVTRRRLTAHIRGYDERPRFQAAQSWAGWPESVSARPQPTTMMTSGGAASPRRRE